MGDNDIATNEPHGNYTDNRYALSGKIMLSAIVVLFAVVILVIALHLYARWYLSRYRRQRSQLRNARRRTPHIIFISDLSTAAASAANFSHGLEASVLNSLPTFIYSSETHRTINRECAVCLSEFEENEKGRLLPKCNHSFHTECIDMWFATHSTCPLCRSAVVASEVFPPTIQSTNCPNQLPPPAPAASSSARSTNLGLSIEVPPRRNESFKNTEEEVQESPLRRFMSPGGRILSLRRILNREGRPSTPPPMGGGGGGATSAVVEVDLERGEGEHRREHAAVAGSS